MDQNSSVGSKESFYKSIQGLLIEEPPMPGDIEQYNFLLPRECKESIFCSLRYPNPRFTFTELKVDTPAILNQDILNSLFNSCLLKFDNSPNHKKSSMDETRATNQLRLLKQSLSRITGYNNKRKYEERIGFASTLAAKAEEIGIANTITFLLKVITIYLVSYFEQIGN